MATTTIPNTVTGANINIVTMTTAMTAEDLALSVNFMAEQNLQPGTKIIVTIPGRRREVPADIECLIEEACGMLAYLGGGLAEELIEARREDERLEQAKAW